MIVVCCNYFGTGGWSRHAQNFVSHLRQHTEIGLVSWNEPTEPSEVSPGVAQMLHLATEFKGAIDVGIGIGPLENVPLIVGKTRIAYVVWETTRIPRQKLSALRDVDEIWTPSRWGRSILIDNGIDAATVKVVPEGVDSEFFRPIETEQTNQNSPFRFLSVGKWEIRKGIVDLIRSFCEEFATEDNVELVLACDNPYLKQFRAQREIDRLSLSPSPPIRLCSPMSDEEMVQLYNRCDVFVLPTKGEGWGLPIVEAMACGLPVIVTDYSGYKDFVSEDCGFFIKVAKMVPVKDKVFYSGTGYGKWAQPDLGSLKSLLRHVYENPDEVVRKGRLACEHVARNWTWRQAIRTAVEVLKKRGCLS